MPLLYYFNVLVHGEKKQKVLFNKDISTLNKTHKYEVLSYFLNCFYQLMV